MSFENPSKTVLQNSVGGAGQSPIEGTHILPSKEPESPATGPAQTNAPPTMDQAAFLQFINNLPLEQRELLRQHLSPPLSSVVPTAAAVSSLESEGLNFSPPPAASHIQKDNNAITDEGGVGSFSSTNLPPNTSQSDSKASKQPLQPPKALDGDAGSSASSEAGLHRVGGATSNNVSRNTFGSYEGNNAINQSESNVSFDQNAHNKSWITDARPFQPSRSSPGQHPFSSPSQYGTLPHTNNFESQRQPKSAPISQLEIRGGLGGKPQQGKRFPTSLVEHAGPVTAQSENAGVANRSKMMLQQMSEKGELPDENGTGIIQKPNCHGGLVTALTNNPSVRFITLDAAPACVGVLATTTTTTTVTKLTAGRANSITGSVGSVAVAGSERSSSQGDEHKAQTTEVFADESSQEHQTAEGAQTHQAASTTTTNVSVSVSATTAIPTVLVADHAAKIVGKGVALVIPWPTRAISEEDANVHLTRKEKEIGCVRKESAPRHADPYNDGEEISSTKSDADHKSSDENEGTDGSSNHGTSESTATQSTKSVVFETFKATTTITPTARQFPNPSFKGLGGGRVPRGHRCLVLQNVPIGVENALLCEIVNGAIAAALAWGPPAHYIAGENMYTSAVDAYVHEAVAKEEVAGGVPSGVRVSILGDEIGLGRTGRFRHVSTWFEILKMPEWAARRLEAAFVLMDSRQCIVVPATPETEEVCIQLKEALEKYRKQRNGDVAKGGPQVTMNGFLASLDHQLHSTVLRLRQGPLSSAMAMIEHVIELGNLSEYTKRNVFFPDIPTNFTRFQFVKQGCQLPQDDIIPTDSLSSVDWNQSKPMSGSRPNVPPPHLSHEGGYPSNPQSRNYNFGAFNNNNPNAPSNFHGAGAGQYPPSQYMQQRMGNNQGQNRQFPPRSVDGEDYLRPPFNNGSTNAYNMSRGSAPTSGIHSQSIYGADRRGSNDSDHQLLRSQAASLGFDLVDKDSRNAFAAPQFGMPPAGFGVGLLQPSFNPYPPFPSPLMQHLFTPPVSMMQPAVPTAPPTAPASNEAANTKAQDSASPAAATATETASPAGTAADTAAAASLASLAPAIPLAYPYLMNPALGAFPPFPYGYPFGYPTQPMLTPQTLATAPAATAAGGAAPSVVGGAQPLDLAMAQAGGLPMYGVQPTFPMSMYMPTQSWPQ